MKKLRYAAYHNMPKDPMHNGAFHICVEGLSEAQKRRESPDPEVLYIGVQMGANFGPEYQKFYNERFVDVVNGQLKARTSMFRSALGQITDDVQNHGTQYNPSFDLNTMDDE